jgi:hypothetical protein
MVSRIKKAFFGGAFVIFLPVFFVSPLWGTELEISGGLGNIAFDTGRESYLGEYEEQFEGRLFQTGRIKISGEAENNFYYDGGFERDFLLRNRLFANMGLKLEYVTLEVGPLMGLFNSKDQTINPGFSAGLGLEFPGILFITLKASSSLGSILNITGNYLQKTGEISAGFWVPYAICSFNMITKGFDVEEKADLLIEDSANRYFFRADVFSKNVPYTCRVDLGYQSLKRSYSADDSSGGSLKKNTTADEFKFLFIGLEASYMITPEFKMLLGGELPIYSWSAQPMKDPAKGSFFFQAHAGVVLTLAP